MPLPPSVPFIAQKIARAVYLVFFAVLFSAHRPILIQYSVAFAPEPQAQKGYNPSNSVKRIPFHAAVRALRVQSWVLALERARAKPVNEHFVRSIFRPQDAAPSVRVLPWWSVERTAANFI